MYSECWLGVWNCEAGPTWEQSPALPPVCWLSAGPGFPLLHPLRHGQSWSPPHLWCSPPQCQSPPLLVLWCDGGQSMAWPSAASLEDLKETGSCSVGKKNGRILFETVWNGEELIEMLHLYVFLSKRLLQHVLWWKTIQAYIRVYSLFLAPPTDQTCPRHQWYNWLVD